MLIWLPERIYNQVKDQPHFKLVEQAVNEKYEEILSMDSANAIQAINDFNSGYDSLIVDYFSTVKEYLNPNMQREIDIINEKDEETLLKMLEQEGDTENLLMGIYQDFDVFKYGTDEAILLQEKYLDILKKKDTGNLSFRIYLKAMQLECRKYIRDTDFAKYPTFAIEGIKEIVDSYIAKYGNHDDFLLKATEEYNNIIKELYSQELLKVEHIKKVLSYINMYDYQYKKFNPYKMSLYRNIFVYLFEFREFKMCHKLLEEMEDILQAPVKDINKAANTGNLVMLPQFIHEKAWFSTVINLIFNKEYEVDLPNCSCVTDAQTWYGKNYETICIFKVVEGIGR